MPELDILRATLALLVSHLRGLRDSERGSITLEQILITTTLVAAAIGAGAVILARVNDQARAIRPRREPPARPTGFGHPRSGAPVRRRDLHDHDGDPGRPLRPRIADWPTPPPGRAPRTLRLSGAPKAGEERAATFLRQHGAQVVLDPAVGAETRDGVGSVEVTGHAVALIPGLSLPVRGFSSGPIEAFDPVGAKP